jgi:hypothetical protein
MQRRDESPAQETSTNEHKRVNTFIGEPTLAEHQEKLAGDVALDSRVWNDAKIHGHLSAFRTRFARVTSAPLSTAELIGSGIHSTESPGSFQLCPQGLLALAATGPGQIADPSRPTLASSAQRSLPLCLCQ